MTGLPSTEITSVTGLSSAPRWPIRVDADDVLGVVVDDVVQLDDAVGRAGARDLRRVKTPGFGSGSPPTARAAICSAADRYFCISVGETVSTSPMLSKP